VNIITKNDKKTFEATLRAKLGQGKVLLLVGPRQVGKTTLVKKLLANRSHLFLDGDDPTVRALLETANTQTLQQLIGSADLLFIDEAQRIPSIGLTLKIIADRFPSVQLIVSGSSSFDLKNSLSEPLTGRKWEYQLFPISWAEWEAHQGYLAAEQQLEHCMVYGMYPDLFNYPGNEKEVLKNLTESYLYRDLFALTNMRKPELLEKLLQALAFQLGNEVSLNELAQLLGIDKNTVASYIEVLKKGYVIFSLPSFCRNLRNEIKRNQKIYFYDNGIRNAVIGNLTPLANRTDTGALWENFMISERVKYNAYQGRWVQSYFWRTVAQQEVDYLEESNGHIRGYEFKWNPKAKIKIPKSFTSVYDSSVEAVHRSNFRSFVMPSSDTQALSQG
jgi:predicted AAA+ superfamily ATPase